MPGEWLVFLEQVRALSANPLTILLAFGLARLIRGPLDAVLIALNFWLLTELLATLAQPDYGFGALAPERLCACVLQLGAGYALISTWRSWRVAMESVAAD